MRRARIKGPHNTGCYHITSRIVDRAFRMDAGERERFRDILRRAAAFSGVSVFTYAILSNHFHLLVEVPEQPALDDAELLRRVAALYGAAEAENLRERWDAWAQDGVGALAERERERLRGRMGDISPFMKLLKQRYTQSYNRRHRWTGTLWEGRYASVLVEGRGRALAAVAAYVDLNPVRAGMVSDPSEYRWSGYGEAYGGSVAAQQGLIAVHAAYLTPGRLDWSAAGAAHRALLCARGADGRGGFSSAEAQAVINRGGRMPLADWLRCRVRYFRDGVAFGSAAFVEGVFERNRAHFGSRRRIGARKIRFCREEGFRVARDLRRDPVSVPSRA